MLGVKTAVLYTAAIGLVVFLCRAFPFLFLRPGKGDSGGGGAETTGDAAGGKAAKKGSFLDSFLAVVEKVVPPAAMTVLAVNSIAAPVKESLSGGIPALAASLFTLLVHLWRRNFLISILGGTVLYMVLERFI
jgi:branched-subunit amino acid transport protein AzlD